MRGCLTGLAIAACQPCSTVARDRAQSPDNTDVRACFGSGIAIHAREDVVAGRVRFDEAIEAAVVCVKAGTELAARAPRT